MWESSINHKDEVTDDCGTNSYTHAQREIIFDRDSNRRDAFYQMTISYSTFQNQ